MYEEVHWIVPCIGGVIIGIPSFTTFVANLTYLSESYLEYAASAQAGNMMLRSLTAGSASLWASQMFAAIGVGGGGSLLGGIACLLAPIPFLLYRYGPKIRARSMFALAPGENEKELGRRDSQTDGEAPTAFDAVHPDNYTGR